MRKTTAALGAGALAVALSVVPGALADTASAQQGTTNVTFAVTGLNGGLDLGVPSNAPMVWVIGQDYVSGTAGTYSVRDRRNGTGSARAYQVTASISDFSNGAGGTIPKGKVTYTAGGETMGLEGTGAQTLDSGKVVVSHPGHGWPDMTALWTPTLRIDLSSGATIGNWGATLTHSVA
ncbi:hypothetical protein JO861_16700 [Rhodococcus hoagii]|uniref:hypothetical protein n=1 Tax=Rhodococcus hoagii TaxID=43767 RepID=UPI00196264D2|nr:hypothetical protein [Prescottella equi]MBM9838188.1 hypothetical protein [Prescottella equi]